MRKQTYRYGLHKIMIREFDPSLPKQQNFFSRIRCRHDFSYKGLGAAAGIQKLYICDKCGQVKLI
ncbi:hypothetical protein HB904_04020 [Listeria booriae]|uniref:Uncharacterized protein n=1 Tax=Listeria booriae TaxID=1552123 RepID=A0A842ABL1_9LIST|nr:hypothetical protein [Listeria booriae]MBC1615339.1 hypothetical protein [Listeria booriae]